MPYQLNRWTGVHNERTDRIAIFLLKILLIIAVPMGIVSTIFASIYAWIQAREYGYGPEDWQRCLIAPNRGGFGASDQTIYAGSAATFGMKAIVFMVLSFNGVNAGLLDHDMLPYSLFVSFTAIIGISVYRESSPIQPEPKLMSVTLATLTKFIHQDMYAHLPPKQFPPAQDLCAQAYHFNRAFLAVQFIILCLAIGLFFISVFTILYSPRDYLDVRLEGNRFTLVLVVIIMTGYVLTLVAKEIVACDTMDVLQSVKLGYMFMFKKADMDVISMTMMVTCGSVLVGTFHECRNKFKLASFMAFLHVLISFPVITGTYAGYDKLVYPYNGETYNLWNLDQCKVYINTKNLGIFKGYDDQLTQICQQVVLSLIGQTIIFIAMFLQMIACMHVVYINDSPVRPPHETRCMSCAYRNEGQGVLSIIRQPTIMGSLSMYSKPAGVGRTGSYFEPLLGGRRSEYKEGSIGWSQNSEGGVLQREGSDDILTQDLAREVGYTEDEDGGI